MTKRFVLLALFLMGVADARRLNHENKKMLRTQKQGKKKMHRTAAAADSKMKAYPYDFQDPTPKRPFKADLYARSRGYTDADGRFNEFDEPSYGGGYNDNGGYDNGGYDNGGYDNGGYDNGGYGNSYASEGEFGGQCFTDGSGRLVSKPYDRPPIMVGCKFHLSCSNSGLCECPKFNRRSCFYAIEAHERHRLPVPCQWDAPSGVCEGLSV